MSSAESPPDAGQFARCAEGDRVDLQSSTSMDTDLIEVRWSELGALMRERWMRLTEADIGVPDGHREYLVAQLQKRYGWDREQAEDEVEQLEDELA